MVDITSGKFQELNRIIAVLYLYETRIYSENRQLAMFNAKVISYQKGIITMAKWRIQYFHLLVDAPNRS